MMEKDRKFYESRGIASRVDFGRKPAIIVVDLTYGFTDPTCPLGAKMDQIIENINLLIREARLKGIPIIFTRIAYEEHLLDAGLWLRKMPALRVLKLSTHWVEIDERLNYQYGDPVITKKYGSSFFGTSLNSMLRAMGVDTRIITGASTSGCIRATCIDAISLGYYSVVPRECVGDRASRPHGSNLFDIDAKYSDVIPTNEVIDYLRGCHEKQVH